MFSKYHRRYGMFASSLYLSFANFTDTISLEID